MFFCERKDLKEKMLAHIQEKKFTSTSQFINYAIERAIYEPDQLLQNFLEIHKSNDLLRDEVHNQLYASYTYISELYRLAETIGDTVIEQGKTETEHYESTKAHLQDIGVSLKNIIIKQFANLKPKEEKQSGK